MALKDDFRLLNMIRIHPLCIYL